MSGDAAVRPVVRSAVRPVVKLTFLLLLSLLPGCASLPDPQDARAYNVEPNQPHFPGCASVREFALDKATVFKRCGDWGCTRMVPKGGVWHCTVYYYENSMWVRNHERLHTIHGPRHAQPVSLDDLMKDLREWWRNGQSDD